MPWSDCRMLGLLLRVLPFWVREPLLIVVGSVFGVRIMYLAVRDHSWTAAGIGAAFLLFTAVRVHAVVQALRARKRLRTATSAGGAAVDAAVPSPSQPYAHAGAQHHVQGPAQAPAQVQALALAVTPAQAGTGPVPRADTPKKDHNAWGQAVGAVAVFGVIAAVLWLGPRFVPSDDNAAAAEAASCSDGEHDKLPKVYKSTPRPVTGEELCRALNRPDLAALLGTPGETATTASSNNSTAPLTDQKVAAPEAEVQFDTYTVNVSATYNGLSTDQYVKLMKYGEERDIRTLTVLGRPAVFSSDHTMKIEINLGGEGSSGPVQEGPLARTLSVALDRKDRGGSCDITVWSKSGALPSDSALVGIAEKVLPRIPERSAR